MKKRERKLKKKEEKRKQEKQEEKEKKHHKPKAVHKLVYLICNSPIDIKRY